MMSKVTVAIKEEHIDIRGIDRQVGMVCEWDAGSKRGKVKFMLLGKEYPGIYSIKNDTLQICWTVKPGAPCPTKFEKGLGHVLMILNPDKG